MINPITTESLVCSLSMIDDRASIGAPIRSFFAISATQAPVATVRSEIPIPDIGLAGTNMPIDRMSDILRQRAL